MEVIALGRRKSSTAHARLTKGSGKIMVNGKKPQEYFPNPLVIQNMETPLFVTNTLMNYDVEIKVEGGGFTGQSGASRLAIARALVMINPDYKKILREQSLMTRDSRAKERKKYGKYGARRSPQFVKR